MSSDLNLAEFSFFEKATGLMADAEYMVMQVTFEEGNGRLVTSKGVHEFYSNAKKFLGCYDYKDVVSIKDDAQANDAFQSAKSIATLVREFAKYSVEFSCKELDTGLRKLVNKSSGQYAFELTDPNTSMDAYKELKTCLTVVGYAFALEPSQTSK